MTVRGDIFVLENRDRGGAALCALARQAFGAVSPVAASTVAEAQAWLARQPRSAAPVCLIDLALPDGSGAEFVRRLVTRLPKAKAIIVTAHDDDTHLLAAMAAGAHGYLLRNGDPADLLGRLRRAGTGEPPLSPAMADRILTLFREQARALAAATRRDAIDLTAREEEVLRLIGRGLTVAEAAGTLGLSALTVAGYVKAIYRKLEICSRAEAATEAARRGLL